MLRASTLMLFLCFALSSAAAEPPATAQAEIRHLLDYLERSGCQFSRNGSWHRAQEARRHLDRKYRHLLNRGLISSAEHFIERAASASSVSGKPYRVRCADGKTATSAEWLIAELLRYRSGELERVTSSP